MSNDEKSWWKKKENWVIFVGGFVALVAVCLPFFIMKITKSNYKLTEFQNLGTVGDFFGGTTVGLLSLASIIFVTAAMIMQKQELELQRLEVSKTREEYEITNQTMKKQQFDSTFFNMITLHQNILKEIELGDLQGRNFIQSLHGELKKTYESEILNDFIQKFIGKIVYEDLDKLNEVTKYLFKEYSKNEYINEYDRNYVPIIDEEGYVDDTDYYNFIRTVKAGTNIYWLSHWEKKSLYYEENLFDNNIASKDFLESIDIKTFISSESEDLPVLIKVLYNSIYKKPLNNLKVEAYEKLYKKFENLIGHYYRNLYRIIKLIQDNKFSEDKLIDIDEKQKYRGILRAQLSSFELLMIFYNVAYSKKGSKFRDLLVNTNFFDDHLIQSDFIWKNDLFVLEEINRVKSN